MLLIVKHIVEPKWKEFFFFQKIPKYLYYLFFFFESISLATETDVSFLLVMHSKKVAASKIMKAISMNWVAINCCQDVLG